MLGGNLWRNRALFGEFMFANGDKAKGKLVHIQLACIPQWPLQQGFS